MKILIGIIIPIVWFSAQVSFAESPKKTLERGTLEFDHKNFGNAVKILRPLIYPVIQLTSEDDIVKAHEILALSHFYIGKQKEAKDEFVLLLYLHPGHKLDPFLVPPAAVSFFQQIKNDPELKAKLEKIERERKEKEARLAKQNDKKNKKPAGYKLYFERTEVFNSRLIAFLPFGLGQFQNNQSEKGIAFAVVEGAALITNISSYWALIGLANEDGRYSDEDITLARGLRVTQYVSLAILAASFIYGVIDANIYFEPSTLGPYKQIRQEEVVPGANKPTITPTAIPSGAGLSFSMQF
jgi:hypothetical protein